MASRFLHQIKLDLCEREITQHSIEDGTENKLVSHEFAGDVMMLTFLIIEWTTAWRPLIY